jgi:hypothetical protein
VSIYPEDYESVLRVTPTEHQRIRDPATRGVLIRSPVLTMPIRVPEGAVRAEREPERKRGTTIASRARPRP